MYKPFSILNAIMLSKCYQRYRPIEPFRTHPSISTATFGIDKVRIYFGPVCNVSSKSML